MTKKAQTSRRDTKSRQTLSTRKALAKGRTPTYHDGLREGIESALDYRDHAEALRRGRPMVWEDLKQPPTEEERYLVWRNQAVQNVHSQRAYEEPLGSQHDLYGSLERTQPQHPPACKDCKWFEVDSFYGSRPERFRFGKCRHPKNGCNPVSGRVNEEYASTARGDYGGATTCGSKGTLFEKRTEPSQKPKPSFLSRIMWWVR